MPTFGLDVTVDDPCFVEICKALQHLQRVYHDYSLVLNTAMLEQTSERTTRAVFHEDVNLISVGLDTVVGDDVGVVKHLQYAHFVLDLRNNSGNELGILEADLLDSHEVTRIEVHSGIDGTKCTSTHELALLPSEGDVGR